MMRLIYILIACILCNIVGYAKKQVQSIDLWPDGTEISDWFRDTRPVDLDKLGKPYKITDFGVVNDGLVHTTELQALIDKISVEGGGVMVVPEGTFLTGAIFFKPGVHLYVKKGGTLLGSSNPSDYPLVETRIEGENCLYYPALINADGVDGFTISGEGTIDGNGFTFWKHFWERRKWNPKCTNKDEQRPRLIYVSNSKDIQIDGVNLQNSAFWTTHIFNCQNIKLLNLHIFSPATPVKAPSTDAIDLDVVRNVLIKNCYMSVNDDAVAIKGGKGPYADAFRINYENIDLSQYPEMKGDGPNENILIEDCEYGFSHGCLTLGSESVYNHNIILRRIKVNEANNLLWLKMRPDTPQQYEYVTVEDIEGNGKNFLLIAPWTQFYDLKGRDTIPMSYSDHITMRNIKFDCDSFFNVKNQEDQYHLSNFTFENLDINAKRGELHPEYVDNFTIKNVNLKLSDN